MSHIGVNLLRALESDEELAERVSYAWAGLSRACHQHAYELPPTSTELSGWLEVVEQLIARVKPTDRSRDFIAADESRE